MRHAFLSLGLLVILTSVYLDTQGRGAIAAAVGAKWSPSAILRAKLNGVFAGCSTALTIVLLMVLAENPELAPDVAVFAAALSLFHAAVHVATYHLLLRRLQAGGTAPSRTIDQFLDPRRLSYLDMAFYWAVVFALVSRT